MNYACIYIIYGSIGQRFYDAGFDTHLTANYKYRAEGGIVSELHILEGDTQSLNVDYLPKGSIPATI